MRNSPVFGILVGVIFVLMLVVYSMGMKIKHISGNRDDGVREKLAAEERAFACTQKMSDIETALKNANAQEKKQAELLAEVKSTALKQSERIADLQKENERLKRSVESASATVPTAVPSGT